MLFRRSIKPKYLLLIKGTKNNYILRIEPLSPNTLSRKPYLKLPSLRSVSTGSCLQLEYRTKNLNLELKTASQTMTLLPNSSEWKFVNVNIRPEAKEYQVFHFGQLWLKIYNIQNKFLFSLKFRFLFLPSPYQPFPNLQK